MFNLGRICENLGLKSISKVCMQQIKPDNLQRIIKRESILSHATDIMSNVTKSIGESNQPQNVSSKVQAFLSERAKNRGGREV
jgi:tRNA A37 N6-isopentenylltransferase MiaA